MANLKPFSDVELGVLGLEAQKGMKFTGEVVLRLIDTISNERGEAMKLPVMLLRLILDLWNEIGYDQYYLPDELVERVKRALIDVDVPARIINDVHKRLS